MLNSNKNRKNLGNLNKLVSLHNQVEEIRLQDKLGKQNYHEIVTKFYEPLTDTIKNNSEI